MANHANDLSHLAFVVFQMDVLANRILARKVPARQHLVDYNDQRYMFIILRAEKSTAPERNPHAGQIVSIHDVIDDLVHLVVFRFRLALGPEQHFVSDPNGNRAHRLGDHSDAGQGSERLVQRSDLRTGDLCGCAGHRRRKRNAKAQDIPWIESGIDVPQLRQASDQQACAGQEHKRGGDLHHHQHAQHALMSPARSAPAVLEAGLRIGLRCLQRRR